MAHEPTYEQNIYLGMPHINQKMDYMRIFPPTWLPIQSNSLTGRRTTYPYLDDC